MVSGSAKSASCRVTFFDQPAFDHAIQLWEEDWVLAPSNYSTKPTGNAVKISENLLSEFF